MVMKCHIHAYCLQIEGKRTGGHAQRTSLMFCGQQVLWQRFHSIPCAAEARGAHARATALLIISCADSGFRIGMKVLISLPSPTRSSALPPPLSLDARASEGAGMMKANCMRRKDLSILLACLLFVARSTCKVHGAICTRVSPSVAESMMVLFAFGVYLACSLGLVCMTDLLTARSVLAQLVRSFPPLASTWLKGTPLYSLAKRIVSLTSNLLDFAEAW